MDIVRPLIIQAYNTLLHPLIPARLKEAVAVLASSFFLKKSEIVHNELPVTAETQNNRIIHPLAMEDITTVVLSHTPFGDRLTQKLVSKAWYKTVSENFTNLPDSHPYRLFLRSVRVLKANAFNTNVDPYGNRVITISIFYQRFDAILALGNIKERSVVTDLIAIAKRTEDHFPVQQFAIRALGKIKDSSIVNPLRGIIEDDMSPYYLKIEAAIELHKLKDPYGQAHLKDVLAQSYIDNRILQVIKRLAEPLADNPSDIEEFQLLLRKIILDEQSLFSDLDGLNLKAEAAATLGKLEELRLHGNSFDHSFQSFSGASDKTVGEFLEQTMKNNMLTYFQEQLFLQNNILLAGGAAIGLAHLKNPEALEVLLTVLTLPHFPGQELQTDIKEMAVEALGVLKDPAAIQKLKNIVAQERSSPYLKCCALKAIASIDDSQEELTNRSFFEQILNNPGIDSPIRGGALEALASLENVDVNSFAKIYLDDPKSDMKLKHSALKVLGKFGNSSSVSYLGEILNHLENNNTELTLSAASELSSLLVRLN